MKRVVFLFLIAFLGGYYSLFSQSNCNPYFLIEDGREWTIKNYSAKDKYQGKQSYKILSVAEEEGALIASVNIVQFDNKDKEILNESVEFSCEDGVVKMDMSNYVPISAMESFKHMDVEMEFKEITIPANLSVGQSLEDGGVAISVNGPVPLEMQVEVKDRKVESKESVTVPAGEFETFKVTSLIAITGMGNKKSNRVEYIAKEIGPVRTESYNAKGKLQSYSVLSSYSN